MRIQTREQTEDFFHDVIAKILPQMKKSDIRPAFQKTKQPLAAGTNHITQSGEFEGLDPFSNTDNFIYFFVNMNNNLGESEVMQDNTTSIIRNINVIVYCYGNNSSNIALKIKAMMRSIPIQQMLNFNGYYLGDEGEITPLNEDINGEWWERNDLELNFTCRVDFTSEAEDIPVIALDDNKTVIVDGEVHDGR